MHFSRNGIPNNGINQSYKYGISCQINLAILITFELWIDLIWNPGVYAYNIRADSSLVSLAQLTWLQTYIGMPELRPKFLVRPNAEGNLLGFGSDFLEKFRALVDDGQIGGLEGASSYLTTSAVHRLVTESALG